MAQGFSDELKSRLPEIVLSILAAKQGGPQALGAFQGSVQQARQQRDVQARQVQLDEERRQQQTAAEARAKSADQRAAEASQMQKLQAALGVMDRYASGVGETATDPVAAESSILSRGAGLETAFGLPQGQLSPFVPNMGPAISTRKKKLAQELYTQAEKLYGPEAMAGDSITIKTEAFGDVKPSQLRALFTAPAVTQAGEAAPIMTAKPEVPNTPEERVYAALAKGDTAEVERLRQAAEIVSGARRKPEDEELTNINKQLAQMRLDSAQAAKTTAALPPATQRRVDMKTRAFDAQPVVKRIQTMAESVMFAEGLNPTTTNPADDQALIYAFAKAMDPESVVREGEYATVQKYAQSWAESFGFNAARIFSNTTFLTPEARSNMKATIRARFAAAKPQYENLRQSYATQISRITNQGDGDSYLVDYAAAFPSGPSEPPPPGGAGSGGGATYDEYLRSRGQR